MMFSAIRRRFTYANTAATLALVFAMSGSALAAQHYLITSTKQISPKVIKALQGHNGVAGSNGATGPTGQGGSPGLKGETGQEGKEGKEGQEGKEGTQGKEGKEGKAGKEGPPGPQVFTTLPSGSSESGQWAAISTATGAGQTLATTISIPIPLATAPAVHFIAENSAPPAGCSGSVEHPSAEPGNLCVFVRLLSEAQFQFMYDSQTNSVEAAGDTGTTLAFESTKAGTAQALGTWAVSAK
jgi:Collagen triple helix repeat (20 copies)